MKLKQKYRENLEDTKVVVRNCKSKKDSCCSTIIIL